MNTLICYATGGLGNRIFPLASALEYAKASNRKLYLYWPKDRSCNAEFADLYSEDIAVVDDSFLHRLKDCDTRYYIRHKASADNDLNIYGRGFLASKQSTAPEIRQDSTSSSVKNLVVCSNTFLNEVPLENSKKRVKGLRIKSHIRESIDVTASELGLDKSVVGMHIRGTDFPPPSGWKDWLSAKVHEGNKVFVCSDESTIEDQAYTLFPDNVIILKGKKHVTKSNPSNPSWRNNVYTSKESLEDSIRDLYLLGKTNVAYYNSASTFGAYAKLLSEY